MMEKLRAKDGHIVLKYQGRYLASSVDPIREAAQWVQTHESACRLVKNLIVLGAGSGYHLLKLQSSFPEQKIFCIDGNAELIRNVDDLHGISLAQVTFINPLQADAVLQNAKLVRAIQSTYVVLKHEPSVQAAPAFYKDLLDLLRGREEWAYRKLIEKREDLKRSMRSLGTAVDGDALLSIKTLVSRLSADADPEIRSLFLALKELVT